MSASGHSFDICARDRRSYSSAVTEVAFVLTFLELCHLSLLHSCAL